MRMRGSMKQASPPRAPSSSGLTRGSAQDAARTEFATLHHRAEDRPADPRDKPEDDGWGGGDDGHEVLVDADERFVKHARPTQSTVILGLEPRIYPRCRSGRVCDLHHLAEGRPADPRHRGEDDGWGGGVDGHEVLDADERFVKHPSPTPRTVILGLEPRIYPRRRSGRVCDPAPSRGGEASRSSGQARG